MRLAITHTTRYEFEDPVVHALQRLRLTPQTTSGQNIVSWDMEYTGAEEQLSYEDHNCNTVVLVSVEEGAHEVKISCSGTVDTNDQAGIIGRHAGNLPIWHFSSQTDRTRPGPAIKTLVNSFSADGDKVAMLHDLSREIVETVTYETGTTNSETTAEEAIRAGHGVCQDHAHIFIGCARMLDIPARYVSGYLMMNDRIEQEASHAWAEAHVDGLGWVGFDISNQISPDARYVRVATGLDYADAAPISGMRFGSHGIERLVVDIQVAQ